MRFKICNLCLIYLFVSLVIKSCKSNEEYQELIPVFLQHFVEHLDSPAELILFLCYKTDKLIKIAKHVRVPIGYQRFGPLKFQQFDKRNRIIFATDTHCPEAIEFLDKGVQSIYYRHPFRWIIFCRHQGNIPKISALVDSNIFVVTVNGKDNIFSLSQVYNLEENSPYIFETYGNWNVSTGFHLVQKEQILSRRRRNLQRTPLTGSFVILNNDSVNHLDDYRNKHIDPVTKSNFIITKYLIETLNGTIKCRFVPSWGKLKAATGEWTGMIKDMIDNKSDFGGTPLFITAERMEFVDYLAQTTPLVACFIFRQPPLSFVTNIYALPFTTVVWVCSALLVEVGVAVLILTIKFQSKIGEDSRGGGMDYGFSDFVIFTISGICRMAILLEAKIVSARMSMIFLLASLLFLYTSYTANIVAFLQSTSSRIQTLSDILHSNLEVGVEDTTYNRYFFESATDPVRKAIYEKKVLLPQGRSNFINISEGLSRLQKGLYAFHVQLTDGYKGIEETFLEHEKCNLKTIQFIQENTQWYSVKKASPYKEIFKVNLFKLREYGLLERENAKFFTKKPKCSTTQPNFESVKLLDCHVVFEILLVGYLLAVFILLFEKIIVKFMAFISYKLS